MSSNNLHLNHKPYHHWEFWILILVGLLIVKTIIQWGIDTWLHY